jgi:hypothetical protein
LCLPLVATLAFFYEAGLAPDSGLPSLLTAISSQHFFIELILAAPARGLPSFDIALVSQEFAASADPVANVSITAAITKRLMAFSLFAALAAFGYRTLIAAAYDRRILSTKSKRRDCIQLNNVQ